MVFTETFASLSLERSLLGAMILDPARAIEAIDSAKAGSSLFVSKPNAQAYRLIRDMAEASFPVTLHTVVQRLREEQRLDELGGIEGVESWIDACPTPTHADYFVSQLTDKAMRRAMLEAAEKAKAAAGDVAESAELIRSGIEAQFAGLALSADSERTNAALLNDYDAMYEAALSTHCAGIRSGFGWWDDNFGGLQERTYYCVSGPPGCFKTTLVRNIVEHVAGVQGLRVDFCSLEQSAGQILSSMAARMSGTSVSSLQSGRSSIALARWREARATVAKWPVHVIDQSQNEQTLWSWARRAVAKGSRLLVLDYLQFVKCSDGRVSEEQRLARASDAVRRIAFDLRIPFIAISSESNEGKLRHSGQIEYDAWCWVRMRKDEDAIGSNKGAIVSIKKNRFGPQVDEWRIPHRLGALDDVSAIMPETKQEEDHDIPYA